MKTPNEIAWNLLEEEVEMDSPQRLSRADGQRISDITGIEMSTLSMFWKKLCMRAFIFAMDDGIEIAKQVIDEMETGKPHYEIDIEGI
jgi:hypothetical protein